jgi:hypothetical protein
MSASASRPDSRIGVRLSNEAPQFCLPRARLYSCARRASAHCTTREVIRAPAASATSISRIRAGARRDAARMNTCGGRTDSRFTD